MTDAGTCNTSRNGEAHIRFAIKSDKKCMLWMYQRGPEHLRIATTFDNATKEYVITITLPHGTTCERFNDADAFQSRLAALEGLIQIERWRRIGDPVILRHGWKVAATFS